MSEKRTSIERIASEETHIRLPDRGATEVLVVRNGDDYRGKAAQEAEALEYGGLEVGQLMPSSSELARLNIESQLIEVLAGLTPRELSEVDIVIGASDSQLGGLATSDGSAPHPYQRCVDTARAVLEGAQSVLESHGMHPDQLLNHRFQPSVERQSGSGPEPMVVKDIEDLKVVDRTEEYFGLLEEEAKATGVNKWVLYERDDIPWLREVRESWGIEGPSEIAGRMTRFLSRVRNVSDWYHRRNPGGDGQGRRLIAIVVAPQDLTGPFLNMAAGLGHEGNEIPRIQHLGGFNVSIKPDESPLEVAVGDSEFVVDVPNHRTQ